MPHDNDFPEATDPSAHLLVEQNEQTQYLYNPAPLKLNTSLEILVSY
jgi:hypothetical protein